MKFSFVPVACHVGHFRTRGATWRWAAAGGARRVAERWGRRPKGGSPAHILNPEGPRREHCQKPRKMRLPRWLSISFFHTKWDFLICAREESLDREMCMSWTKCGKKFMSLIHHTGGYNSGCHRYVSMGQDFRPRMLPSRLRILRKVWFLHFLLRLVTSLYENLLALGVLY